MDSDFMLPYKMEEQFEWRKWCAEIPYLNFDADWLVSVIPPFGGAVSRFRVKHKKNPNREVSVYLDCYNRLGYMDKPYWEIYPAKGGDTDRFFIEETEELLNGIRESLMESPTNSKEGI